ncbi:MAG: peptidylprolyl isomerase [Oscillospiraceae bacterium]|nr:peptidylprolyl isomerase [Oscillospiraceae bacterium]
MNIRKLIALLLVLSLCLSLFTACGQAEPEEAPTESTTTPTTEPSTQATEEDADSETFAYGENDVTAKADYAVTVASPASDAMQLPIAVNAEGETAMTNSDLQVYYWLVFYDFMSYYGNYAAYFGLDYNKPLAQQPSMMENRTWEQYFLESAMTQFAKNYAMAMAAYAEGYTLSEEDQAMIDDLADPQGEFATESMGYGFESAEAYVQANFGMGVDIDTYQDYMRLYYAAFDYNSSNEAVFREAATDELMETYYLENAESFAESRVVNVNNVTVRHILIGPEGEPDVVTGQYSEEAWAAAEAKINDIYAQWQENPTEENFSAMATELTHDTASAESGGLYEDFTTNAMVSTFSDWCFDQTRQPGDTGIVKSDYGYHLIYFVEQTETRGWLEIVREQYVNEQLSALVAATMEQYPIKVDYAQIRIFDMITYSLSLTEEDSHDHADEPVG